MFNHGVAYSQMLLIGIKTQDHPFIPWTRFFGQRDYLKSMVCFPNEPVFSGLVIKSFVLARFAFFGTRWSAFFPVCICWDIWNTLRAGDTSEWRGPFSRLAAPVLHKTTSGPLDRWQYLFRYRVQNTAAAVDPVLLQQAPFPTRPLLSFPRMKLRAYPKIKATVV